MAQQQLSEYADQALASSTKRAYARYVDTFKSFASSTGIDISSRVGGSALTLFAAHALHPDGLGWRTQSLQAAISAIRHHCLTSAVQVGFDTKYAKWRLKTIIKGAGRDPRRHTTSRTRHPITSAHLSDLLTLARATLQRDEFITYRAAALTALHSAARIGELLPRSVAAFDHTRLPTWGRMEQKTRHQPAHFSLVIPRSKTDQGGASHTFILTDNGIRNNDSNPYGALARLSEARPIKHAHQPVFSHEGGSLLTSPQFIATTRHLLLLNGDPPRDYCAHSFRRGAATTLLAHGVDAAQVRALGRWRGSNSHERYLQLSQHSVEKLQRTIARSSETFASTHGIN